MITFGEKYTTQYIQIIRLFNKSAERHIQKSRD